MSWIPPAAGRLTSLYGPRNTGIPGASTFHRGIDVGPPIPGQRGRPVVAVADAEVLATGWNAIRGSWVALRHDDGSTTAYQHLDEITTARGRRVAAGQQIGVMGNTSSLTVGVHLHFECFPSTRFVQSGNAWVSTGRAVDPVPFMKARGVNLGAAVPISSTLWTAGGLPRAELDLTLPDPLEADVLTDEDKTWILEEVVNQLIASLDFRVGRLPFRDEGDRSVSFHVAKHTQILDQLRPMIIGLVKQVSGLGEVDEEELAAALAPLLQGMVLDLDDENLDSIAQAVSEEIDRRARERGP